MNYLNFNTFLYGEEYPIVKWEETDKIEFWLKQMTKEVKCPKCGILLDRDYNTAINIMYEGLKIYMNEILP